MVLDRGYSAKAVNRLRVPQHVQRRGGGPGIGGMWRMREGMDMLWGPGGLLVSDMCWLEEAVLIRRGFAGWTATGRSDLEEGGRPEAG